jgi:hypothetical protein
VVDWSWFPRWICIDRGYDEFSCLSTALVMMPNRAVARFGSDARGIINTYELIEGESAELLVLDAGYPEPPERVPKPASATQRELDSIYKQEYEELMRKSKERLAQAPPQKHTK